MEYGECVGSPAVFRPVFAFLGLIFGISGMRVFPTAPKLHTTWGKLHTEQLKTEIKRICYSDDRRLRGVTKRETFADA